MRKIELQAGFRSGNLEVIEFAGHLIDKNKNKVRAYLCRCDAGGVACQKIIITNVGNLLKGEATNCGSHTCKKNFQNLLGKKFGFLEVINYKGLDKNKSHWECLCKCGTSIIKSARDLLRGSISCGCNKFRLYEEISAEHIGRIFRRAAKVNMDIDITPEYMWDMFIKQNKQCALSGVLLDMSNTASLDRIDSSKGYVIDNVQWVHKIVNFMKWDLEQDKFLYLCGMVAEFNK